MKLRKLLFLGTLFFSSQVFSADRNHDHEHEHGTGALEEAPVLQAGIHALESFQRTFEADGATLGSELIGFKSKAQEDNSAAVSVFNTPEAEQLHSDEYNCSQNTNAEGSCELVEQTASVAYTPAQESFTVEEFKAAASEAVGVFEEHIHQNPGLIQKAKAWRSYSIFSREKTLHFVLDWGEENAPLNRNSIFCHYHQHNHHHEPEEELEIDCHRGRPGPHEPPSFERSTHE